MHALLLQSCKFIVDSVNQSSSVRALVYTSSIAAMMDSRPEFYREDPIVDERRHPSTELLGAAAYNCVKDRTETFFATVIIHSTMLNALLQIYFNLKLAHIIQNLVLESAGIYPDRLWTAQPTGKIIAPGTTMTSECVSSSVQNIIIYRLLRPATARGRL